MFPRSQTSKQTKPRMPQDSLERGFEKSQKRPSCPERPPPPDTYTELPQYLKELMVAEVKYEVRQFADNFWEQLIGVESNNNASPQQEMMKKMEQQQGGNHTPLDFEKLHNSHAQKDEQNVEQLRQRLFQMVKSGTEKAIEERKKEEEERKRAEEEEEQRKKQEEEEERQAQMAQQEEPQGKQKGKLGQPRKKAHVQESNFEAQQRKKG